MDYGYTYHPAYEEAMEGILAMYSVSSFTSFALSVATYVLMALGLYTIAKRRGISKPWLAWIPVADAWLLGSISDQYRYVVKGETKSKRKILLTLRIVMTLISVAIFAMCVALIVNVILGEMNGASDQRMLEMILGPLFGVLGTVVFLLAAAITYTVFYFMALYDVYTSLDPRNNVLYLVLSIFIGVTQPFFVFFNRNKDDGMPPRKAAPMPDVTFDTDNPYWRGDPEHTDTPAVRNVPLAETELLKEPWEKPDTKKDPWEDKQE